MGFRSLFVPAWGALGNAMAPFGHGRTKSSMLFGKRRSNIRPDLFFQPNLACYKWLTAALRTTGVLLSLIRPRVPQEENWYCTVRSERKQFAMSMSSAKPRPQLGQVSGAEAHSTDKS